MDIKTLRTEFGYSAKELAELVDVHISTVYRWFNGDTKPEHDHTLKLQALITEKKQYSESEIADSEEQLTEIESEEATTLKT